MTRFHVLIGLPFLATFIEQFSCGSITRGHESAASDHSDLSGQMWLSEQQHSSGRSGNTDALRIEFIEYIVLAVIVLFLVALLFMLRYMLKLKERCPQFCCGWFPSPELRHAKQYPQTMDFHTEEELQQSKVVDEPSAVGQSSDERVDDQH